MALFVIAGQSCSEEVHGADMMELADRVRRAAHKEGVALPHVRTCFAPAHTDRKWAVYSPTPDEVASHRGNWWAAERATRCVPALGRDLAASATETWAAMDEAFEEHGLLLLCGCSNGCILATEYATTHPERVRALLLFSGLPSLAQQGRVDAGQKQMPPACLTVGTWESYFGGRESFESVAASFACPLVVFEGGHCQEHEAAVLRATRLALQAACLCP